ncbi:chemotaxis protein CheR [Lysobacter ciconiae]|uniref:Chemotaxis protein methyltransferase n=1 Tax=Novilysobacter ciconiae TaxID=2781022 RepID=A0A7S6UGZ2_9GAMM|nr:CheR family methyltransferase [Lysobacter ciconiae]QOW20092.1 chemotaxis protein CheR [Lysobacter ciconiae]
MADATAIDRRTPPANREFVFDERDFRRVARLIHARAGIALSPHKRDMVYSRLARRVRACGMQRFDEYLDALEADDGAEWEQFTNALTTNLTSFFRESHHFDMLSEHLLAAHAARRDLRAPLTIWCCAASTGEEPYSIAIAACEAFGTLAPPVRILATDIDTRVLETAALGRYSIDRIDGVSPQRRQAYFQSGSGPNAGLCRVRPELQALVSFRPLNLLDDDYGLRGGFCAVFCRNVMIYFDKPTQYHVLSRIAPLLGPGALMFAGHSESFTHAQDLVTSCGRTTYRATHPTATP